MIPIQDLLHRIRWDPDFGRARFELGYFDRMNGSIIRVSLGALHFPEDAHGMFELIDEEGISRSIPLHRIKSVWRDGELIWHRGH
jgi:uncharacterized protein (UPF0248 family)